MTLNGMVYRLFLEVFGADVVLGLDVVQLLLLLVHVHPFERLVRLIVEHHQVSIAHVEAGQMVARVLGVENVFVDDKCGSARVWSVSAKQINERYVLQFLIVPHYSVLSTDKT